MKMDPKEGILVVRKHSRTALKHDIAIEESDDDKKLITGEVLSKCSDTYPQGVTVIYGKYALYVLQVQGVDYYLLDEQDVLGTCDYKEKA